MIWQCLGIVGVVTKYLVFKDLSDLDIIIALLFFIVGELQMIRCKRR